MRLDEFTLIVPYYRNCDMLAAQVQLWNTFPKAVKIILVDDGSPEPAMDQVMGHASKALLERLSLYRIDVDIPWNRGGARNLGAFQADTTWIAHIDIDHMMPAESAAAMLRCEVDLGSWYRFPRFRVGKADETRRKDAIPDSEEFGEIKPHVDSYLCTSALYWRAGGYNEDFSGCLGGGTPFLAELSKIGPVTMMPASCPLHVYTRDKIKDASDHTLSRDTAEFSRRKLAMGGKFKGRDPLRFPWTRLL